MLLSAAEAATNVDAFGCRALSAYSFRRSAFGAGTSLQKAKNSRRKGLLLRGALDQLPHKSVHVADEDVACSVRAFDRLTPGRDHGSASLGPLFYCRVDVAHDHGECG